MKRRVCETCFFFESAGLNNSGWCRHPERQFNAGVRLVVRGNEIACRNGWNADYWVSAEIDPAGAIDEGDDLAANGGSDEITSIVPARYEAPAAPARPVEDVVVQHISYPAQSQPAPDKDARDLVTNPRAAILKAREQFKVRQKREGRIADQEERPILRIDATDDFPESDWRRSPDPGDEWVDDPAENAPFLTEGAKAPRPPAPTVAPVPGDEMRRPFPTITTFAEDTERFESIPMTARRQSAPSSAPDWDHDQDDPQMATGHDIPIATDDGFWDDGEQAAYAEPVRQPRRKPFFERFLRRRQEHPVEHFADDYVDQRYEQAAEPDHRDRDDQFGYAWDEAGRDVVIHAEDDRHDLPIHETPLPERQPEPAAFRHERPMHLDERYPDQARLPQVAQQSARPMHRDDDEPEYGHVEPERLYAVRPAHRAPESRDTHAWSDELQAAYTTPAEAPRPMATRELHRAPVVARRPEPEYHDDYFDEDRSWNHRTAEPEGRNRAQYDYPESYDESHINSRHVESLDDAQEFDHWGEDVVIDPVYARGERHGAEAFELPPWRDDSAARSPQRSDSRPVPQVPNIAANVPRVCRTCRDFRPSESEDRGWCNNPWAFKHRRMVDADSLSCGSSALGSWWTPNDAVWQRSTDVSRHAQETPLLDRLLASRYQPQYESGRRAGGSGER